MSHKTLAIHSSYIHPGRNLVPKEEYEGKGLTRTMVQGTLIRGSSKLTPGSKMPAVACSEIYEMESVEAADAWIAKYSAAGGGFDDL